MTTTTKAMHLTNVKVFRGFFSLAPVSFSSDKLYVVQLTHPSKLLSVLNRALKAVLRVVPNIALKASKPLLVRGQLVLGVNKPVSVLDKGTKLLPALNEDLARSEV